MWTTCAECMTWYRNGSAWSHLVSIGEMRTLKRWVASHLLKWDKEFQKIFLEDLIFISRSLLNSEWRPVSFQEKSWGKDWLWVLGVSCGSFEGRTKIFFFLSFFFTPLEGADWDYIKIDSVPNTTWKDNRTLAWMWSGGIPRAQGCQKWVKGEALRVWEPTIIKGIQGWMHEWRVCKWSLWKKQSALGYHFPGTNTRLWVSHFGKPFPASLPLLLLYPQPTPKRHTVQIASFGGCKERRTWAVIPFPLCHLCPKRGQTWLLIICKETHWTQNWHFSIPDWNCVILR